MKPLAEFKAAIFDLDGTLLESMQVWDSICRDWLLAQGKNPLPQLESDIALMTLGQSAEYVRESYGIELLPERIIAGWRDMALAQYQHTVALKPGAAELLQQLVASGLKLALATSCFPAACQAALTRHGLWQLFAAVVYSDEVSKGKMHPDIWLACAERLGVSPADCVVFEDLRAAGAGIRAAGMSFVAVRDDCWAEWEELKNEADLAVLSLSQLQL